MFEKIDKHMKAQKENPAEDFQLTHEAKFQMPTLEKMYWANPNDQKGSFARCAYDVGGIRAEVHYKEGN